MKLYRHLLLCLSVVSCMPVTYGQVTLNPSFDMILRHPERHSKAVMHDFLHKPEFCAACHKANLPAR